MDKGKIFRELHASTFVMPNPWDVGTTKLLASFGFKALATTSAGFAFSRGLPDGAVTFEAMIHHCRELTAATSLPVSADLEKGKGDSAEGYAVLALYDITGKPALLDAVNVAVDRSTSFREPGKLSVDAGDDVLITTSTHFNSSQGYVITLLIMIRNDKFELIDMIYTFDENLCAYRRQQEPAFQTIADGQPRNAIQVTVTDATLPSEESCDETPPAAVSTAISVTYHWDKAAARYVKDSDALDKLAGENAKRF